MGYTHYWRRPSVIDSITFHQILQDAKLLAERSQVPLECDFQEQCISVNGKDEDAHEAFFFPRCSHDVLIDEHDFRVRLRRNASNMDLIFDVNNNAATTTIATNNSNAGDAASPSTNNHKIVINTEPLREHRRTSSADMTQATTIGCRRRQRSPQNQQQQQQHHHQVCNKTKRPRLYFTFCKTARKPYDKLVTALLMAIKYHLGDNIRIVSDGEWEDWSEGRQLYEDVFPDRPRMEVEDVFETSESPLSSTSLSPMSLSFGGHYSFHNQAYLQAQNSSSLATTTTMSTTTTTTPTTTSSKIA